MASINLIKASDGTGNASTATVQTVRNSGVTTIIVDTVNNIPATFMGSMGTPHTFVDPVTSEEITVISEATAVDFTGHVSGANLEIDSIAPGYTDLGSAVGDIVVIRPTTAWADNIATVLAVAHNDNGTLKNGAISSAAMFSAGVVNTAALAVKAATLAKIDGGTTGGILQTNTTGDVTVLNSNYCFSARQTTAVTLPAGVATLIPFNSTTIDPNSNFSGGSYTTPARGIYTFSASVAASMTISKTFVLSIYVDGYQIGESYQYGTGGVQSIYASIPLITLNAGSVVLVKIYNGDTASQIVYGYPTCNVFSGRMVGAA
jgi:hypothetical protein